MSGIGDSTVLKDGEFSGFGGPKKKANPFGLSINCQLVNDTFKYVPKVKKPELPKSLADKFSNDLSKIWEELDSSLLTIEETVHRVATDLLTLPDDVYREDRDAHPRIVRLLSSFIQRCETSGIDNSDVKTLKMAARVFQGRDLVEEGDSTVLGNGGFAVVHQVRILGEEYAQKKHFNAASSMITRESKHLTALNHPNIIKLIFQHEGSLYLELADDSLEGFTKNNRLTEQQFARIYFQIADALCYMHGEGYVHGDIKKENILLKDQEAKVSDFGTAIKISEFDEEQDRKVETSINSPPEHLRGELDQSKRESQTIDVWAFGLLLWHQLKQDQYYTPFTSQSNLKGLYHNAESLEAAIELLCPGDLFNVRAQLDPVKVAAYDPEGIITDLMERCLDLDYRKRPSMIEIKEAFLIQLNG